MEKLNSKKFEKMQIEKSATLTIKGGTGGGNAGTTIYTEKTPATDPCASNDVEVKKAQ